MPIVYTYYEQFCYVNRSVQSNIQSFTKRSPTACLYMTNEAANKNVYHKYNLLYIFFLYP